MERDKLSVQCIFSFVSSQKNNNSKLVLNKWFNKVTMNYIHEILDGE